MFAIIRFNQDCNVVIQDTVDSMPYPATYQKDEVEHVDILAQQGGTMHVQFEDGSVGWIKSRYVEIRHMDLEE